MDFINTLAEQYAEIHSTTDDALLKSIYEDTLKNHPHAHMISGLVQGRLLAMLSKLFRPKYVLEIGTFTGFSAICLAEGLQNGGELHTIELREADAAIAKQNFALAKRNNQIHLHAGDAGQIIPTLDYTWDVVFIDADKTGYIKYYEMVLPRLQDNGVIIADNVLFHGQVLEKEITGKNAKAIDLFNKHVANDERTEQVMLTVRDGLTLIKKRNQ
ncbi:MAG TPA: O-methyltransferase [Chitinophagaceae bacterium]|nr:O-methyltransferase [Chitinophagaceae bacterium]